MNIEISMVMQSIKDHMWKMCTHLSVHTYPLLLPTNSKTGVGMHSVGWICSSCAEWKHRINCGLGHHRESWRQWRGSTLHSAEHNPSPPTTNHSAGLWGRAGAHWQQGSHT